MPIKLIVPAVILSLAVAFALAFTLAGRDSHDRHAATNHAKHRAAKPAVKGSVELVTPRDNAQVGSSFTAKVRLHGFKLDPKSVGKAPRPGYGHLHFQLDGGRYDQPRYSGANGKVAAKLGVAGKLSPALAPEITYSNLPRGRHRLKVYLAHNNHVDTGAADELAVVVR